jgi:hypothetical protein
MTNKFDTEHAEALKALSAYQLASIYADCGDPDTLESAGAEYLTDIRDDVLELFLNDDWGTYPEDDMNHIADRNMPPYYHRNAQVFVDLCAYNEDISEMMPRVTPDNALNKLMAVAVCRIGERLASNLYEEYKHTLEEQEKN